MPVLEVHPASESERRAAFGNVHEFWGRDLPPEEFVRRRLASPQHNFARWFVGCLEGRVVSSLGCYPCRFNVHGQVHAGIAVGAVHTLPEFRGRGFAPQVIARIEQYYRDRNVDVSVLFSDIDPDYYARLGYVRCPSWYAWKPLDRTTAPPRLRHPATGRLEPFDIRQHRPEVERLYADGQRPLPLWLERDAVYWDYALSKAPGDEFYWVLDRHGATLGYVRLAPQQHDLLVRDAALQDIQSRDMWSALLTAVLDNARQRQVKRAGGWLPDAAAVREHFSLAPRDREITMLKSLREELRFDDPVIAAAEHIREIDHV